MNSRNVERVFWLATVAEGGVLGATGLSHRPAAMKNHELYYEQQTSIHQVTPPFETLGLCRQVAAQSPWQLIK